MKCGTAIRQDKMTDQMMAAAECFSYEDENQFLKTLTELTSEQNLKITPEILPFSMIPLMSTYLCQNYLKTI